MHAPFIPCILEYLDWYISGVRYEIRVGRSREPTGPFLDRAGKAMLEGGGTLLLQSQGAYIGPGQIGLRRRPQAGPHAAYRLSVLLSSFGVYIEMHFKHLLPHTSWYLMTATYPREFKFL